MEIMHLARFSKEQHESLALVDGEVLLELAGLEAPLNTNGIAFLEAGERAWDQALAAVKRGVPEHALNSVTILPLLRPRKILAVGLNYADHVAESGLERPKVPMIFNKQSTAINGPFDPIHLPRVSDKLDYEGELGVIIGRRCRHVPAERAHEVIAGYTVVNDVSVRDWQMRVPTFTMGKSFDSHCPIGPWLVRHRDIGNPHDLHLRTWVNGELRQNSNTKHLIFNCFTLIEHLSTAFTLEPGDLIATGTPGGVGSGMKPRQYLKTGDRIRIEIEGIGAIENRVIDEPQDSAFFLIPQIARQQLASLLSGHSSPPVRNESLLRKKEALGKSHLYRGPQFGSGGRIRTDDLRVMSPTSYQTALPRKKRGRNISCAFACQRPKLLAHEIVPQSPFGVFSPLFLGG